MGYAAGRMENLMRTALHRWLAMALVVILPLVAFAGIPKNNEPGHFWKDQWIAAERYMLPPHIWGFIIASLAFVGTVAFAIFSYRRPAAIAAPTAPDWSAKQAKTYLRWTLFGFFALYALGFNGAFSVYDDPQNIWMNHVVKEPTWKSLYEIIWGNHRLVNQEWMFLSLFSSFRIAGKQYWVFFITNWLMLPLLLTLVYRLGRELFNNRRIALLGMVFFGFSPILAELVCWMLERGHYFGITFAIASCTTYLAYMRTSADDWRRKLMLYGMAALFYISCQFGKPIFIYIPLWLIFFDVFRRRAVEWMPVWVLAVPLALVGLDQVGVAPLFRWLALDLLDPVLQTALAPPEGAVFPESDSKITSVEAITMTCTVLMWSVRLVVFGGLMVAGKRLVDRLVAGAELATSSRLAWVALVALGVFATLGLDSTVVAPLLTSVGERLAEEDAEDVADMAWTTAGLLARAGVIVVVVAAVSAWFGLRSQRQGGSPLARKTPIPLFIADKVVFLVLMAVFLRKIVEGGASKGRVNTEYIGGSLWNTLALNCNHVLGYLQSAFIPMQTGLRTPWNEPASWLHVTGIPDIFVHGFAPIASFVILLCLAACGFILARRYRWGMLLLAGCGAVVSVGPVANIPVHTVVHAYRYTLSMNVLVSITLGAAALHIIYNTRKDWVRRTAMVLTIAYLSVGAYQTVANLRAWRHPVHLWTRNSDVLYPHDGWSHYYAGKTLQHRKQYELALAHAHLAIKYIPRNSMANRRIGDAYYSLEEFDNAAVYWEKYFRTHRSKITESYSKKLARVGLESMVPRKHRDAIEDILAERELELNGSDTGSGSDSDNGPAPISPDTTPGVQRIIRGIQRRRLEDAGVRNVLPSVVNPPPTEPAPEAPAPETQPAPIP